MNKKGKILLSAMLLAASLFCFTGCVSYQSSTSATEEEVAEEEEKDNTVDVQSEAKAEGEEFSMAVSCGYGDFAKFGRDMGIQAEITNHGQDFSGDFNVLIPGNNYGNLSTLFKKEVAIASGETKKVEFAVPVLFSSGKIKISLADEAGHEKVSTKVRVNVRGNTEKLYVGLVSDSYMDLSYFTGSDTKSFLIKGEDFPEDKKSLDMLDVIVINDFNTGSLNESQYAALKDFVREGGTLVLGTGSTGSKTMEIFQDDFITGTIGSVEKEGITFHSEIAEPEEQEEAEQPGEASEAEVVETVVDAAEGQKEQEVRHAVSQVEKEILSISLDGSEPAFVDNGIVLMEKISVGDGAVQVFTFDLALETTDWSAAGKAIVQEVVKNVSPAKRAQLDSEYNGNNYFYNVQNSLNIADSENIPQIGKYIATLAIYLVLIDPLLYFVLKKLDKRNLTWVIVPGLALAFSGLMYILGSDTRLSGPYVQYLSFANVEGGKESEKLYFSLTAPYNNPYEVSIPGDYEISIPTMDYYYNNNPTQADQSEDYNLSIGYGVDATTIGIKDHGAFEATYFEASSTSDTEGFVESDVSVQSDFTYAGSVTNYLGYDLDNAVFVVEKKYYVLGDIKEGETKELDGAKSYTVLTGDSIWDSDLLNQAVGGDPWSNGGSSDTTRQYYALQYKFAMESGASSQEAARSGKAGGEGYLIGFTEDRENPIIQSMGLDSGGGVKLVTAPVQVGFQIEDKAYIPNLDLYYVIADGDYNYVYRYINSDFIEAEVCFEPGEKVVSIVYSNDINIENNKKSSWYGFYGVVSAYNYESGQYVDIFEGGTPGEFSDLADYLDGENVMRLRFTVDQAARNQYSITMPVLSAVKEVEEYAAD